MASQDDGSETISKNIINWLTGIVAIATLLGGILGLIIGNEKYANQLAYVAALLIGIVSSGVFFYQRRRTAKLKISESIEPVSPTAALRGLLPFEEGDQLPGRARDIQELYTLVASSSFRFGVLWGESGCGKTSLMRAGLVPKLRNEKFLPLYINKPTNNPQEAIRSALLRELPILENESNKSLSQLLKSSVPKGKKVVVLLDQFEEFFLTNRTPKSREGFIKWLGKAILDEDAPAIFLIGIRSDFFAQLQNFAPYIPEPTSIRTTYQLQNFDTEQAKRIFNAAAKADGVPFEPALIQEVIKELEFEEFIRPAELQVVGTRLKRKNVFTLNKYEVLGGARGILSSYIGEEINQSMNQQVARLILRLMCADVVETKSQVDLSLDDILHSIGGTEPSGETKISGHPEEIQAILNQFVAARVLIHTDDDKYNLAHDYLAPYVRTATEGVETNTERANRLLKRYIAEYKEDKKMRIPFGRTHWIERYASPEVRAGTQAQELIKKSKQAHYGLIAALATPVIILIVLYFFFLTQSYYLSIDKSFIVHRAGLSQFTFLPGFGKVVIATEFKRDDLLDDTSRNEVDRGIVTGLWFRQSAESVQIWGDQVGSRLEPVSQAKMWRWLGQPDRAKKSLIATISDVDADPNERINAANDLSQIAFNDPKVITPAIIQSLIDLVTAPQSSSNYAYKAVPVLGQLAHENPKAITPEMIESLINLITAPKSPNGLDTTMAGELIGSLTTANPDALSSDMLQRSIDFVTNQTLDPYTRQGMAESLSIIIASEPQEVTNKMIKMLVDFFTDPKTNPDVRSALNFSNWSFNKVKPQAIPPDILQSLIDYSFDLQVDSEVRSNVVRTFLLPLSLVNPEAITQDMIQKLMDIIIDPEADPQLRSVATDDLGQLTQARPNIVKSDMLQTLSEILLDLPENSDVSSSVANLLLEVAQTNPQIFTQEEIQSLSDNLIRLPDPSRLNLAYALVTLAQENPKILTPELIQSLTGILINPPEDLRYISYSTLETLGKVNSYTISPEIIQFLVGNITNTQEVSYSRINAATTLGKLAQENPDIITSDIIQSLIDIFKDSHLDSYNRPEVAIALEALVQTNPQAVTAGLIERQLTILSNPQTEAKQRSYAAQVLGLLAKASPESTMPETINTLIDLLRADKDPTGRKVAAYALFGIASGDRTRENMIRTQLAQLQTANQPHLRMAASRIIEMLDFSNPILGELRAHPDKSQEILEGLEYKLYGSPYTLPEVSEDDYISYTMVFIRQEIEKMVSETRK